MHLSIGSFLFHILFFTISLLCWKNDFWNLVLWIFHISSPIHFSHNTNVVKIIKNTEFHLVRLCSQISDLSIWHLCMYWQISWWLRLSMPSSKKATQIPFIWAQISNNIGKRSKHRNIMKKHNTGFFNLHSKYYICAPVMQILCGGGIK